MEVQFLFNSIAFFLFLALLLRLINRCNKSRIFNSKLPPGPWKLPFIGNLHQLVLSPRHTLRALSQKYGPLMHLQLGEVSTIVVSSPRLAKEILKTHDLAFASSVQVQAAKIIIYNCEDVVFAPYGDYWRQMRKICNTRLLSHKMVESFGSIRREEFQHVIASIQCLAARGAAVDLSEKVSSYTSSMVSRATFGKVSRNQQAFLRLMKEGLSMTESIDLVDVFPSYKILHGLSGKKHKLRMLHHKLDMILQEIINEHRENLARKTESSNHNSSYEDLTDVLLKIKESGDLNFPLNDNNIKAIILNMFTAGTETSAATVEWVMSEMMRNPNVMAKAQSEIRQTFKGKKTIDETDIQGLKNLHLVIKETLRLHPPVRFWPQEYAGRNVKSTDTKYRSKHKSW